MCRQSQKLRRGGAAALEFAVVLPVLVLFMFAILDYGRFLMVRQDLDNAAREGARLAAANPGFKKNSAGNYVAQTLTTTDIQNNVFKYLINKPLVNSSNQPLAATDVEVYRADPATGNAMADSKGSAWTKASFGETIAVKITCKYKPMLVGFLMSPSPVSFICMMRSEAN